MRLPENEIEKITWAGLLHDIGKIGIRDNILLKEGPLDKARAGPHEPAPDHRRGDRGAGHAAVRTRRR